MLKSQISRWWKFSARSGGGRFGSALGLQLSEDGGHLSIQQINHSESTLVLRYLPDWFFKDENELHLGAVVAVFDEVSTYAGTTVWDSHGRPGVSIQLAAQKKAPLRVDRYAGIQIRTQRKKMGKNLAFLDIQVSDILNPDRVLVQGQHIKFMPMGMLASTMTNLNKMKYISSFGESVLCAVKSPHAEINPSTSSELFPLEDVVIESPEDENENENEDEESEGRMTARASMQLTKDHANPLSKLHGGAATVMSTLISSELMQESEGKSIKSLSMNLLSAIPVNKRVELLAEFAGEPNLTRSTLVYKGQTAAECLITWEDDDGQGIDST